MATIQGMCKNCGSLLFFDDSSDKCECVFCHCIFPSSEAIEIFNNPSEYTFKNEKIEASKDGKHYYATPVYQDIVTPTVKKVEENAKKSTSTGKVGTVKNEFEISPKDVKAPLKTVLIMVGAVVLFLGIVAAIAIPSYFSRTKLEKDIASQIDVVFEDVAEVNTDVEDGLVVGYTLSGLSCQEIIVCTEDEITEDEATTLFENYCQLRAQCRDNDDLYTSVSMEIFCEGGIYRVSEKNGNITATFTANPVETEAETEES